MLINLTPKYGENYKAGQIYFTYSDNTAISRGITWFTYKDEKVKNDLEKISHCGICVGDGLGMASLAEEGKFTYEDLNKIFLDTHRRIFFREPAWLDLRGPTNLVKICESMIDTPYNFRLAAGFAFVNSEMMRHFLSEQNKKRVLKRFDKPGTLLCSQAATKATCLATFHCDHDFIKTPHDLFNHEMFKRWKIN